MTITIPSANLPGTRRDVVNSLTCQEGGLNIVEQIPLDVEPQRQATHYLRTTRIRIGDPFELVNYSWRFANPY